jgi:hypothetical protein
VTFFPTAVAPFLRRVLLSWNGIAYCFLALVFFFLDLVPSPSMFRYGKRLVNRERTCPWYVLDSSTILLGHPAYVEVKVDTKTLA